MEVLRASGEHLLSLEETPRWALSPSSFLSGRVPFRCERGRLLSVPGAGPSCSGCATTCRPRKGRLWPPGRGGGGSRASQQVCSGESAGGWKGQGRRSREEDSRPTPVPSAALWSEAGLRSGLRSRASQP